MTALARAGVNRQLITFWVGAHYCAIPVEEVQELLRFQQMTPVPLAPPLVRGLINLRGQIVTAIDMRRRFGLPDGPPEARPMNVILHTGDDELLSLLVDRIGEVLDVDGPSVEPPPESLAGPAKELVVGVVKLPERLLLVLDASRVIATGIAAAPEHQTPSFEDRPS